MQKPVDRAALTHRSHHAEKPLHGAAFTHTRFYTQELWHADACTVRSVYAKESLHTDSFTERSLYTEGQALHHPENQLMQGLTPLTPLTLPVIPGFVSDYFASSIGLFWTKQSSQSNIAPQIRWSEHAWPDTHSTLAAWTAKATLST